MKKDLDRLPAEGADPDPGQVGTDWLDSYLPYLLYRVSGLMNARLQGRLSQMNIRLSEWRVLSVLRSRGLLNISGIVQDSLMEQPTVSRVVAKLEQQGLIARKPASDDSRVVEVWLTEHGIDTFNAIAPAAIRHQRAALDNLDAKEFEKLRNLLARIEQSLLLDQ